MNRRSFFRRTLGALAAAVAAPYLPVPAVAPDVWRMTISDTGEFGFGFSGFTPMDGPGDLVGQIKFMGNLQVLSPRTSKMLYGITE